MIRVFTTLYNAEDFIGYTIHTLQAQTHRKFKCYITDDMSTDKSIEVAKKVIGNDKRFKIIKNKKKFYQPGNYWQLLQKKEIKDNDICVTVDGDDWLPDSRVLERVLNYYSDKKTLVTFGKFNIYRSPQDISSGHTLKPSPFDIRTAEWTSSHLRTFKAELFRQIKKEDLISPTGNFWETTGDMACWIPMAEMAGEDRVKYVDDINYVYNDTNPIGDGKIHLKQQTEYANLIKQKEKYDRW